MNKPQTMVGKAVVSVEEPKPLPQGLAGTIVSDATLRPQDLIRAMRNTLQFGWPSKLQFLNVEYGINAGTDLERWCNPVVDPGQFDKGDDYLPDQKAVEQRHDDVGSLIADLMDALEEIAPVGTTFGTHPGDGACMGFWYIKDPEELLDEARDVAMEFDREGELRDDPLEPGEPA